jgi:DNA repair protein RecO (recombination protein O)
MEWTDDGIVLAARPHGETDLIVSILARAHGRYAGLVKGGISRSKRPNYEPGNRVRAVWRARLPEHLGTFTSEVAAASGAALLDDPLRLSALAAACATANVVLVERHAYPKVFDGLVAVLEALPGEAFGATYVAWEAGMLAELGYGLDLARCAATGTEADLAYVSPRTGRAISQAAGEPYRSRLLPLPGFLRGTKEATAAEVVQGLDLTGHFLERHVLGPHGVAMPAPRTRFVDRFRRSATISGS